MISPPPNVAVIRLQGVIGSVSKFRKGGIDASSVEPLLKKAVELPRLKAIVLLINSPGGSPVQSDLITREIRHLADKHDVPILSFIEDVGASGGYWLACAGEEIYALDASIVGSIGVIAAGFGFNEFIEKHGIERRVYTAGKSKSLLDPFQPEKAEDVKKLKAAQADVYDVFTDWVKSRRGERLQGKETELFSGAIFSGRKALELGLLDGLADYRSICRERFGDQVEFKELEDSKGFLAKKLGVLSPTYWVEACASAVTERLHWMRFGL